MAFDYSRDTRVIITLVSKPICIDVAVGEQSMSTKLPFLCPRGPLGGTVVAENSSHLSNM